jgi:hypothetical protein
LKTAALSFTAPTVVGTYFVRLFANDGQTRLATSTRFRVDEPTAPFMVVSPRALDFGRVSLGASAELDFTVTNDGIGTLDAQVSLDAGTFALVGSNPTDLLLGPGESRTLTVHFAPTETGASDALVQVVSRSDAGQNADVALRGEGRIGPVLIPDNASAEPRQVMGVSVRNGPGNPTDWVGLFFIDASTTPTTLQRVTWQYLNGLQMPPATGRRSAFLSFRMPSTRGRYVFRLFANDTTTDLLASANVTIPVPTTPELAVSPAGVDFGPVEFHETRDMTVNLLNVGGGTLNATATVSGTGFSLIGANSVSVAAGQSAPLTVRFAPIVSTASGGLSITSNGGSGTIPLSGVLRLVFANRRATTAAPLDVEVLNGPGNSTDWIGLFRLGDDPATASLSLGWKYLNGQQTPPSVGIKTTTLTFMMPAEPGRYVFVLFANDTRTVVAKADFTELVAPTGPVLELDGDGLNFGNVSVGSGEEVPVVVTNRGIGTLDATVTSNRSAFTLVDSDHVVLAPGQSMLLGVRFGPTATGVTTGSLAFTSNGGTASVSLTGNGRTGPLVTADRSSAGRGEVVTATVTNGPGNPTDWVGLFSRESDGTLRLKTWRYLNGTQAPPATGRTSATVLLTMPDPAPADHYFLRFLANDTFTRLATSDRITVVR